ncbi:MULTISPECIES: FAS1-like dehydratase domain-containing protein [Cupriavidus]|uniref:FAS1-like dehydratase domain-containing protein n=1 Tax=Cupriavidus pinatubonensis (strain JMP 134 / LMG 1197) TaxID=264198 RepID=Q46VD8_CUPPJ|nr:MULTISPECIES: MaoC family dehydratase N-terminal domain-containing protein [Cupriavidus]QYY29321.1 MaoC family dehydratase N-terminal domain-containing protein [Cupriavidus pinatubonensis]TPQ39974.1 acyl-CoA dehydrogenase [Cupriavidus pinatubonensis]
MTQNSQLDHLRTWIGRSESRTETLTPEPVIGLAATFDLDTEAVVRGPLPPLWHWLYFLPRAPQRDIGADGHPALGGFMPPVPLPRRMWAGSELSFERPIHVGDTVTRTSTIQDVQHKSGRSGELWFVAVDHELSVNGQIAVRERHDIVYRAMPEIGKPQPPRPRLEHTAQWQRTLRADPVMLFRYSALTFNGHRIHYDREYTRDVEGYPGLVVHGPMQAMLMLDLVAREQPQAHVRRFGFRGLAPLFDQDIITVGGTADPAQAGKLILWTGDDAGGQAMQGWAEIES